MILDKISHFDTKFYIDIKYKRSFDAILTMTILVKLVSRTVKSDDDVYEQPLIIQETNHLLLMRSYSLLTLLLVISPHAGETRTSFIGAQFEVFSDLVESLMFDVIKQSQAGGQGREEVQQSDKVADTQVARHVGDV